MQLLRALLKVRWIQLRREMARLGIFYALVLILMGMATLLAAASFAGKNPGNVYAVAALLFAAVFVIHSGRHDIGFLRGLSQHYQTLILAEYAILVTPFYFLAALESKDFVQAMTCWLALMPAFFPVRHRGEAVTPVPQFLVNVTNFEWRAGIRKTAVPMLLLWIIAASVTWIPYAPLLLLWGMLFNISSFYFENESVQIAGASFHTPGQFLFKKFQSHLRSWAMLSAPVLVLAGVWQPATWWILGIFWFFSFLMIALFVVSKYAAWQPASLNSSGSVIQGICLAGFVIPFLLPLPLVLLFRNYPRAIRNLRLLEDDTH